MATRKNPTEAPTRFEGFADSQMSFFHALDAAQDRAWFAEHKRAYEEGWAAPMAALLGAVRDRLVKEYKGFELREPKVFRLQRDVRFSLDKRPYKTAVSGVLSLKGRGSTTEAPAALYLELGLETFAGAGMYALMGDALDRFRAAVIDNRSGGALQKLCAQLEAQGYGLTAIETLKTAPRGIDKDHPRIALLKRKGLVAMFPTLPVARITEASFADWLTERAVEAAPVVRWMAQHTK